MSTTPDPFWWKLAGVAIAGACGALCRWGVVTTVMHKLPGGPVTNFPWGTFTVNVLGSLIIGLLIGLAAATAYGLIPRAVHEVIIIGFLGAFTTFSSFSLDALLLLREERYPAAAAYMFGSLAAGVLAVMLGMWIAHRIGPWISQSEPTGSI